MKMFWGFLILAVLLQGSAAYAQAPQNTLDKPEFIRVAANQWTFEGASTGKRFIPFGSNLVFYCPSEKDNAQGIDILARVQWDPVLIRKAFEGAKALNMNVMKVFLPSHMILKDPQTNDHVAFAEMTPSLNDRLDFLFKTARETGVYVSLTFAEWGAHSLRWWQDGGTFIGRGTEPKPDIDSYAVLRNFWKALAERYKDEPMLFSYNLAVEFYMPSGNWGAQKGGDKKFDLVLADKWGVPAWRIYLKQAVGEIGDINARWNTKYATIDDIPQPEYVWIDAEKRYSMPQAMLADYGSFKEYVTYAFFRNEVNAIRSIDKRHMITCGYHPHHPGIGWMSSAQHVAGAAPSELDFLDYTTVHLYTNNTDYSPGVDPKLFHNAVVGARFAWAGKPVMAEEMGHITNDRAETTRETINLVKTLMPHVSGFMLWFLSDVGPKEPFGPLGTDLSVNSFGEEWRKLVEPGGMLTSMPQRREPPARTVTVNRLEGMAPVKLTESQQLTQNWDASPQPVDFVLEKNPMIGRLREKK